MDEVLIRLLGDARRKNADLSPSPDIRGEIEHLRKEKAALVKIIAVLEELKKAMNLRLKDLKDFQDLLDPNRADADPF